MNNRPPNYFWRILFNNEYPRTSGDRAFIKDALYRELSPRVSNWLSFDPRILDSLDNWRYTLKGDAYNMFGDIIRGAFLERDKYIRDAKLVDPERNLMRYTGRTEDIRKPQVIKNWANKMNYKIEPPMLWDSGELFNGYPGLKDIGRHILNSPVTKTIEKTAVPLTVYEMLSQPTATTEQEQDAMNNWNAINGYPLQGGIKYYGEQIY